MKQKRSLKNILTVNFVLVGVLPIVVIGFISFEILSRNLSDEISQKNLALARSVAAEVEGFLAEPLSLLRQVEETVHEKDLIKGGDINDYLEVVVKNYGFFEMIQILDQSGRLRYLTPFNKEYVGMNLSGQDFFRVTERLQRPVWSTTFLSMETGQPTLTISIPSGMGLVVGYLNLTALNEIADRVRIGANGYATITDQEGTTIAHPNRAFVRQRLNVKNLNVIQKGLSGEEGTFRYTFRGVKKLGSVALVPQTGWPVIVLQPVDEAFAPVTIIRNIFLGGASLTIILALVMALTSLKRTLTPLSQLTEDARGISRGRYDFPLRSRSYLEIDALAEDFRIMSEAVRSREAELVKHRVHLEELVDERTAELKKTLSDLEHSNREMGQFTYVASHDLQEPLRMIASYVQLLERRYRGRLDQDADDFIDYAVEGAKRMQTLLHDLLAFNRIGTDPEGLVSLDCKEALDQAILILEPRMEESGAVVTHDPLPTIMADQAQITLLFQHLIHNAILFQGDEPPQVHISATLNADRGLRNAELKEPVESEIQNPKPKMWTFGVHDNGMGIEPQYHERIFQVFQRLHTRDKFRGNGIGLAICRKIVERHGGWIWLESEVGEGSIFYFTIGGTENGEGKETGN